MPTTQPQAGREAQDASVVEAQLNDMVAGRHRSGSVFLAGNLAAWILALLSGLCIGILVLAVLNARRMRPRWRQLPLIALRLAIVGLCFVLLMQPSIVREAVTVARSVVPVLVDTSRSMDQPQGDRTRLGHVQRLLRENEWFWKSLARDNLPVFYRFAEQVQPIERSQAQALKADGTATDLRAALKFLADTYRSRELGGLLILSDGIDTGALGTALRENGVPDPQTLCILKELAAPVYTFGVESTTALRDVVIRELRANPFAFLLNRSEVQASIEALGLDRATLAVIFREDGKILQRERFVITPQERKIDIRFPWVPQQLGKHVVSVEVAPVDGEISTDNNTRSAIINILRDRVRILHLAGHPSWDVRFLRNLLKRDPNIDLISFFILTSSAGEPTVSTDETALIPFPAEELFVQELGGFDLVVFQDFNNGPFAAQQYLTRVSDFVRQGGGLMMIGGRLAFSAGGFARTAIEEILPVTLPPEAHVHRTLSEESFRPRRTPQGREHPILQLGSDADQSEAIWQGLPALEGVNRFDGLQRDSLVLAEHPTLHGRNGRPMPVIAVRETGRGRSMVVATDSIWFWAFRQDAGGNGDPRYFQRFWQNSVRWLTRDPELNLLRVRIETSSPTVGQPLQATVDVLQPDYRPAAGQPVRVEIRYRPQGASPDEEVLLRDIPAAGSDTQGHLHIEYLPTKAGVYAIAAQADVAGLTRAGRDLVRVEAADVEGARLIPDMPLLQQLAERTGGAYFALDGPPPRLKLNIPRVLEVTQREIEDVWATPWVLALACGLLACEWILRRRWGYL